MLGGLRSPSSKKMHDPEGGDTVKNTTATAVLPGVTPEFDPKTATAAEIAHQRRRDRIVARSGTWQISTLKTVRGCGRWIVNRPGEEDRGSVTLMRSPEGVGAVGGVARCGSVWACPSCSAKIYAARNQELAGAFRAAAERGGSVYFLTLTMRHTVTKKNPRMPLGEMWADLVAGWAAGTSGPIFREGAWISEMTPRTFKNYEHLTSLGVDYLPGAAEIGFEGAARYVDVTFGVHGWHPHLHIALFFRGDPDPALVRNFALGIFARWRKRLKFRGRSVPIAALGGFDLQRVDLSDGGADAVASYLTGKADDQADALRRIRSRKAAAEFTRPDFKKAGGRTPWQILADADPLRPETLPTTKEIRQARALWEEWENSSRGRRFVTWSRNDSDWWAEILAARGDVVEDAEIVDQTPDDREIVGYIAADEWLMLTAVPAHAARYLPGLMDAVGTGDVDAVADLLAPHGVTLHLEPPPIRGDRNTLRIATRLGWARFGGGGGVPPSG